MAIIVVSCFVLFPEYSYAQEGEDVIETKNKLKEKLKSLNPKNVIAKWKDFDPLKITGGAGLNLRGYNAFGEEAGRQAPFTWGVNANLNISLYQKINIPFSAMISAQSTTGAVGNPLEAIRNSISGSLKNQFVRVGASPSYKWATVHAGHRSMNFSSLTYANQTFYGIGTELYPGKLRIMAMNGTMPTAEPVDLKLFEVNNQVFNRKATTVKLGYGDEQKFADVIFMKGRDANDRLQINGDSVIVTPEENSVIAFNGQWPLLESLNARLEIASSAFSKNALAPEMDTISNLFHPNFVLTPNLSTTYSTAINGGFQFQGKGFNMGMDYQKFDPGYKTMGVYYFNDDLQNFTANMGFNFSKIQLAINLTGGIQTNNLDMTKQTTVSRTISAANATWALKNLQTSIDYNNFGNSVEYVLNPTLDSLNAIVVTENTSANISYTLNTKSESRHSFSLAGNSQIVNSPNSSAGSGGNTGSRMYTGNLSYSNSPKGNGIKITARTNYNQNQLSGIVTDRVGFGLGLTKKLLDNKINLRLDNDYFIATTPDSEQRSLTSRITAGYKISGRQSLNLRLMFLNRNQERNGVTALKSEMVTALQYQYRFNYSLKAQREKKKEAAATEGENSENSTVPSPPDQ